MKYIRFLFIFLLCACNNQNKVFDIKDFGAVGDGKTINTTFIQKAIDSCHKEGGGTVHVSDGIYKSGTILLKNNVTLNIKENATILGSENPLDYKSIDTFVDATGQERGNCLIGSINAKNIGIKGKGVIDGNGKSFLYDRVVLTKKKLGNTDPNFGKNRPFLLRFVRSSEIELKNIQLKQAAAWACHFYQSSQIKVDSISIYSHANFNNDGIDIDSSHDITITNSNIDTGDDAICFKATSPMPTYNAKVKNCTLKSDWGALKFGTESMGDFVDIDIQECIIKDTRGGGIKILSVDGANISNVFISGIEMKNVDMPIFIRLGERLRSYRDVPADSVGSMKNIVIQNIMATTRRVRDSRVSPPSGILITGTPNHKIDELSLRNINISLPGEGKLSDHQKAVPEHENKYPEFVSFGVLPAYGLYARHINKLDIQNLTFDVYSKDEREERVVEDGLENSVE